MTPDLVRSTFERVAYQLVWAGWLKSYCFTEEMGHLLIWQPEGAQKALFLKDLSDHFGLADFDNRPYHFHMACKGMKAPPGTSFPIIATEVGAFWLSCVRQLGLENDGDGLLGLVHMVTSWGPESESSQICPF